MFNKFGLVFAMILFALYLLGTLANADTTIQGTQATFEWTAASGPVAKYAVYVMRNNAGWPAVPNQIVLDTEATISGVDGERIEVRVAARDVDDNQGPFSPRSEKVFFSTPLLPPTPGPLGVPGQPLLRISAATSGSGD